MKRFQFLLFFLLLLAGCTGGSDSVSSVDGVPISFQKYGQGETTLVLVHGWSCDQSYWRKQVPVLAEEFTVVTLDLAGHGASGLGRTNYTMPAFGADVAAVVAALDLHQVYLVGHSMSGEVIVEAARLLPDRVVGLIGVDTLQEVGWNLPQEQVVQYLKSMKDDFSSTTRRFVGSMFPATADSALVRQVGEDMSAAPPEVAISAMKNLLLFDLRPSLAQLKVPLWCLNANVIPVNFEAWKFYEPGYTAVLMQGVGHFLFLERPDEFNQKLKDMISRMERKASAVTR